MKGSWRGSGRNSLRAGALLLLLSEAAVLAARPAAAQSFPEILTEPPAQAPSPAPFESLPAAPSGVPGTWDLSRDGTTRRCVMTLAAESGPAGRALRFPAGCRRALPVTAAVAGWLFADGVVRLVDRDLRPVLLFARRPDRRSLVARAGSGEVYSFVPLEIAAMRPPAPPEVPGLPEIPPPGGSPAASAAPGGDTSGGETPARETTAAGLPAAEPPRAGSLLAPEAEPAGFTPGVYALDRYRERDVCRLDLAADYAVRVAPGCRDGGIEIFEPVSWRFAAGRLTLAARRGHTLGLVPAGDGRWRRDPETGTTLVLRRVE